MSTWGTKSFSMILLMQIPENRKKKLPDHMADSCKHLSINQMAASLKLPRSGHWFFLLSSSFQTHFVWLNKTP